MSDQERAMFTGVRRVAVIGCPGSGKTWLARRLSEMTGLPQFCLDDFYWRTGWVRPSPEEWTRCVEQLVAGEHWIIDGNYADSLNLRVQSAELVVFLDLTTAECLIGVFRRFAVQMWRPNRALPRPIHEASRLRDRFYLDPKLVDLVCGFRERVRPRVLAELSAAGPSVRVVTLSSRADVRSFAGTARLS